jgi:glycosyltransferase 2 family protein
VTDAARPPSTFDRGVVAATEVIRLGIRPFAAPPGQRRTRRATDVVVLVPSVLVLVYLVAVYPPSSLELALIRALDAFPEWLEPVWAFLEYLVVVWAAAIFVATLVTRRLEIAAQGLLSLAVALLVGILAARVAADSWPNIVDAFVARDREPDFPEILLAAAVALIGTASPHLVRPLRRVGRWLVLLGVVGTAVSITSTPGGAVAALVIGLIAASVVNLLLGTSAGRAGLGDVGSGLEQLGVHADGLVEEENQVAGVIRLRASGADGRPLLVKVYGRDAADNQLVQRLWRTAWYRSVGPELGSGRLHAVEREAFVTLLVRQGGIPTRDVVTAGETVGGDALLVLAGDAQELGTLTAEQIDDVLLGRCWDALGNLAELRVAHQQLDQESIALLDGEIGFLELGGATVAPVPHQLEVDRVQLLATTAALAGTERAIAAAVAAIGPAAVGELLPYLQEAALSSRLRRALKDADIDVDDLRETAAAAVEVEMPELVNLRRVSWRAALQIGLLALASYTIISAASGVDWDEVRTSVADASWAWIVAALVLAQTPRVAQAVSTLGSVPAQLQFGPVYAMQLATGYMNVAMPANIARLAVNIRFFQRQGLSSTIAVASGAIDSFASTVLQAVLLVLLLVFSSASVELDVPLPSGDPRLLLWIVAGILVASIAVLVTIPRLRNALRERFSEWWPDVKRTLASLRGGGKLAQLVLGSLAAELLFAVALGLFARAFGYDLSLAELLLINISVSLLGTLVPIPGNIGVAEFGLTVGLTGAGMSPEAALGAVFLYRIATFYLPPIWGFVALRWLQRERYL